MCLDLTKSSKKLIAEEDIICYKLVIKENDQYLTFFQESEIEIGKEYTSELITEKSEDKSYGIVNIGLHSFKTKKGALLLFNTAKSANSRNIEKSVLIKCVIPKGSEYIQGLFGVTIWFDDYEFKSFASTCIKYIEEV